jgi:hypothetical protein
MKATFIRLGIRGFNPKLKKAAERLESLRTPDSEPIPPTTFNVQRHLLSAKGHRTFRASAMDMDRTIVSDMTGDFVDFGKLAENHKAAANHTTVVGETEVEVRPFGRSIGKVSPVTR